MALTATVYQLLEYTEGTAFSKGGISDPDDPVIVVRDLTGAWTLSVTDGECFLDVGGAPYSGAITRFALPT